VPLRKVNMNVHAYLSGNEQSGEINLLFHAYLSDFPLNNQINMNVQPQFPAARMSNAPIVA
jgi:hypothetical protein